METELEEQEHENKNGVIFHTNRLKECKQELNYILQKKEALKNIKNRLNNLKLIK